MARIEPLSLDSSGEASSLLQDLVKRRGYLPNLYATLARSPAVLDAFLSVVEATRTGTALSPRLRELAILAIARETGATTQWLSHLPLAADAGVTPAQLASLPAWEGSPAFESRDRAVLTLAKQVATSGEPSEPAWTEIAAHLDERELVELSFVCAFYSGVSRLLNTLQVEPDQEYLGPALEAFRGG